MKQIIATVLTIFFITTTACKKEPEHYIRFKNEYFERLNIVKLDEVSFGPIEHGVTTDYKFVYPGTFPITLETKSGLKGQGTVTLKDGAPGRNNWLVVVNSKGQISSVAE